MSNLEHYFENLLFEGLDYEDEINKRHLTPEEINAVETCATYITYTFFCVKEELKKYINGEIDVIKTGKWIEYPIADGMNQCSACGVLRFGESNYCPNCGARMEDDDE